MKTSFERISDYVNLKTLVVLITIILFFFPARPNVTSWLNDLIFPVGASLTKPSSLRTGLAIVEIPEDEMAKLYSEPGNADIIYRLLKRMTDSEGVTIGIILDEEFDDQAKLLTLLQSTKLSENKSVNIKETEEGGEEADIPGYLATRENLIALFEKPQVFVSLPSALNPPVFIRENEAPEPIFEKWIPPWLRVSPPQENAGFTKDRDIDRHLIFQSGESEKASLALAIFNRHVNNDQINKLGNNLLNLGDVKVNVSSDGTILPNVVLSTTERQIKRFSLAEARNIRLGEDLVLLGKTGSPLVDSLAKTLLSLESEQYFYTPSWFSLAELFIAFTLLLFLLLIIPRMSSGAGVLAIFLLLFAMIVAQLGWQITQGQWLPFGLLIQYLLVGFGLMFLWRKQSENNLSLQAAAHGARYQLGLQLFRDGRSDDALLAVKECYPSDAVLTLMYDIASQQERKRQYGEAVKTYGAITARNKNYKDVSEKIEKLIAFSSGGASSFGADGDIAKTLLVSETSIHKPVLGRYEIERELGRGAMGIVYLGRDPKISRQVAIKTLSYSQIDPKETSEFKERFFREAEAAGRLSHPNIVTIYDVGEEHDLAFIAMDYVKGVALSDHVSVDSLLPVKVVCQIVSEVADALDYAHRQKIIHRDIKPGNILYRADTDEIKVTDFGVARIVDSARTNTGDILGSPLYMSPEQLKGEKVGEQSDIYSLGVTFFQLLTGDLPFNGENIANLTYNIIHQKHKSVRDIRPVLPVGLTRIVNRALHKEPGKRYTSGSDFSKAIKKLLVDL
ncbi:hypothetical protein NBRC116493_18310 [Aurantivibrio infirmus]